jgi:hypothetical protein
MKELIERARAYLACSEAEREAALLANKKPRKPS